MARKRWRARLSSYDVPGINPNDPVLVEDSVLVQHALVDFDELGLLSSKTHELLVAELVDAVRFARCGVSAGKRGVSDEALAQQIFLSDVARALKSAGLTAKRWRKRYDKGDEPDPDAPESFFFGVARAVAEVCGIALPIDLKLPGKRAAQHQCVMSPAMKPAQEAELEAQQKRLKSDLQLIKEQLECVRQKPVSAKIRPKQLVPGPIPKAIADRTREEMDMGKKMNSYHASRKRVRRKPSP